MFKAWLITVCSDSYLTVQGLDPHVLFFLLQVCSGLQQSDLHAAGWQHGVGGQGLPGGAGTLRGRHRGGTGFPRQGGQEGRRQIQAAERSEEEKGGEQEEEEDGQRQVRPGGEQGQPYQTGAVIQEQTGVGGVERSQVRVFLTLDM